MVQSSVPSVRLARIGGGYVGEETFDETWVNADGVGANVAAANQCDMCPSVSGSSS